MKSYPAKFKEKKRKTKKKTVVRGKLFKWEPLAKFAKFHTNPYNFVACLPNPYKPSILGDI